MTDYINNLAGGVDFVLNEQNDNLSGGEKQKISILKVLHKNPQIMIFDEPTAELDVLTSKKLMSYLQKIKNTKIIIIITHDKRVKSMCDEIVSI